MELRGISFGSVAAITEVFTLDGDTGPRARPVVRMGGGVVLSDGRASARGLAAYLASGIPESETEPFFLAFRPTGDTSAARTETTRAAASLMHDALGGFSVTCAVVLDFSRLSTEDLALFLAEAREHVSLVSGLGLPLVVSVSVLCRPDMAGDLLLDSGVDGLMVADSVPWSALPVNAQKAFFRTTKSPLEKAGGGMVSGKYLLPLTLEWVRQLRRQPARKPVIAGGGILRPKDVDALKQAGANAITIAAARKLRPWNVWRIMRRARTLFG